MNVLVVGESVLDVVNDTAGEVTAIAGGSPANVAVGLARLGIRPTFVTHLGQDDAAAVIRAHIESTGATIVVVDTATPTSTATATIGSDGGATYEFAIAWNLSATALEEVVATRAPLHLHTGSIATVMRPGADAVASVIRGPLVASMSFDPNIRPGLIHDRDAALQQIRACLTRANVVKASDEDIAWMAPGEDPVRVAARWLECGPSLVVVTLGAVGAWALGSFGSVFVPAREAVVVDTVGAGDSFMSALIAGWLELVGDSSRGPARSLSEVEARDLLLDCVTAASITVGRRGAQPPTRAELIEAR
ncbi:PfkB family carbohydrate kinase [Demequina oxidasica]|uniref:PfkB family carbohydrate kinase n=1 Tax=Demequina oxidasica TaxID=676199 RepID=UPI000781FAC0|nr:PfkB family carbohydrate kinase [Demequina oxidasica]